MDIKHEWDLFEFCLPPVKDTSSLAKEIIREHDTLPDFSYLLKWELAARRVFRHTIIPMILGNKFQIVLEKINGYDKNPLDLKNPKYEKSLEDLVYRTINML